MLPLFLNVRISNWWSAHAPWCTMTLDFIYRCVLNLGVAKKEEQSLGAGPVGATHTCTLYHCLLMDTLWCRFQDKTIKPHVSSANTMQNKCGPQSVWGSRMLFVHWRLMYFRHFFHFREWHMNDGKIKVSAPAMSKHPLMQLTYQHMENFPQSFFLRDVTSQPRTSKDTGRQKQRAWAVSKKELHSHF